MHILVDDSKGLSPDSILSGAKDADFVLSSSEVPNYGYRDANFWFKIRIQDASAPQTRWLLQSTRTQIDSISRFSEPPIGKLLPLRGISSPLCA